MDDRKICFEKIKNARDLGGLAAADGKHIKSGLLIRCGHIGKASENDVKLLEKKYALRDIVDFRIAAEIDKAPDKDVPGAEYHNFSVLDDSIFGIARDQYSIEAWLNLFKDESDKPEKVFGEMYMRILFSDRTIPFVQQFFDILLSEKEGAVLWHCSAGKDRAGVMTLLLLCALGVSRDDILKDYMLTKPDSEKEIFKMKLILPLKFHDKQMRRCVYTLLDVEEKYIKDIFDKIDGEYGNEQEFLSRQFGINEEKISLLRQKYLE